MEPENTQTDNQPSFAVPEEYKDRGWAGKIASQDDLWKGYDNAQSMLGKRPAGIPQNDAPQEEWEKFYQVARPESADKYQFSNIEGIPDTVDMTKLKGMASQIAYDIGLTPRQADDLLKNYMKLEMASHSEKSKDLDAKYDTIMKEHFGDDVQAAQNNVIEFAKQLVPESLREGFGKVEDPLALAAIASLAKGAKAEIERIKAEYGAEGKLTSGHQSTGSDLTNVRTELAKLRTSPATRDPFHADHKANLRRIEELSAEVQRALK